MRNFLFVLAAFLFAAPVLHAEQLVTGTVQNVNPEARSVTIQQTNAPTGELRTVYVASVIDKDLVDVDTFEDLQVGDTVSIRVSNLHNISYEPAPAVIKKEIIKETKTKGQGSDLFNDVGTVHHRSLSID